MNIIVQNIINLFTDSNTEQYLQFIDKGSMYKLLKMKNVLRLEISLYDATRSGIPIVADSYQISTLLENNNCCFYTISP